VVMTRMRRRGRKKKKKKREKRQRNSEGEGRGFNGSRWNRPRSSYARYRQERAVRSIETGKEEEGEEEEEGATRRLLRERERTQSVAPSLPASALHPDCEQQQRQEPLPWPHPAWGVWRSLPIAAARALPATR
jgi:hypothetical protein